MTQSQNRITQRGPLLDEHGQLVQKGYATSCVLDYDPNTVKLLPFSWMNRLRLKEWDYYGTTTGDFFFSCCVANIGYMGLVFAYLVDFKTRQVVEKTLPTPFGFGCSLPKSSETGDIHFNHFGVKMDFLRREGRRELHVEWKRFHEGRTLKADLELEQPEGKNAIVMVTPIREKHFYYNHKINCMLTQGTVALGEDRRDLTHETAQTTLDWGRGIWEYGTFWNWANASGRLPDGRVLGLNLGKGFGDLSYASENTFYLDGEMHKLGWLELHYDDSNYMKPWTFKTDDDRLNLVLEPFVDRPTFVNLGFAKAEGHQMFGKYSGTLVTNEGETLEIENLIGWTEEHVARW